jgi:hypothetical protein
LIVTFANNKFAYNVATLHLIPAITETVQPELSSQKKRFHLAISEVFSAGFS